METIFSGVSIHIKPYSDSQYSTSFKNTCSVKNMINSDLKFSCFQNVNTCTMAFIVKFLIFGNLICTKVPTTVLVPQDFAIRKELNPTTVQYDR